MAERRSPKSLMILVAGLALYGVAGAAGADVYVGASVASDAQVSIDRIDHSEWSKLLAKYVDAEGRVAYRSWKASPEDQRRLAAYLATLSSADLDAESSTESRLAYWINAYNAVTVAGILREYPTSSIRNHTAKVWGYNIWKNLLLRVDGDEYSLDRIEHEVLRKMGEPRIHFAIVCAAKGCPRLADEAYVADRLSSQLDSNARHFFASPSRFRYDADSGVIHVSAILDWFGEDFGDSKDASLSAIAPYLPTPQARTAATNDAASLQYLNYDWSLNEQAESGDPSERAP